MGSVIGVDEAGRGPVIGPLVVAGFKLASETQNKLLGDLRVRDSKKCTPTRREQLAIELRKIGQYSIKMISASEIDEYRKKKTLNVLEGEMFAHVINKLSPDEDTTIIVDSADANAATFKKYIKAIVEKGNVISEHKADDVYPVVGAASILAKVERDAQIEKIAKNLKVEFGSGYPSDSRTITFLENWIKEKGDLPPHTRRSWNTAQRLLKNFRRPIKPLDKF